MDFSLINFALVAKLLLLLLIGMGPKIALVPFLEKTKTFDAETQRAVGRKMVVTAVVTALVLFAFGALLMQLLHITGGAVAVAGGIILATLAIDMVHGPGKKIVEDVEVLEDPHRLAVYPLAVPYLLNPVGITILIIASGEIVSFASAALVVGLILLVGAFDYVLFANIDKRVLEVKVADNQRVKAGETLFRIDPQPYEVALQEAEARLAGVGQTIGASTAAVTSARSV
jgi:small neutral amino acid transporter SnatA (MarC family)